MAEEETHPTQPPKSDSGKKEFDPSLNEGNLEALQNHLNELIEKHDMSSGSHFWEGITTINNEQCRAELTVTTNSAQLSTYENDPDTNRQIEIAYILQSRQDPQVDNVFVDKTIDGMETPVEQDLIDRRVHNFLQGMENLTLESKSEED